MTTVLAASTNAAAELQYDVPIWLWGAFIAGIVVMLLLDLFVLHRDAHDISIKEAAITSAVWIAIGIGFTGVVYFLLDPGGTAATQYLTGYIIEKSLSVDNVFVWAVIFGYFAVPGKYQHRVLFWGIFGALVMRAIFIFAGAELLERFSWMLFVFGGLLIFTAWKVAFHNNEEIHPEKNLVLRLVRRIVPVAAEYDGQKLFTRRNAKLLATPLFVVLVLIEATDLVFAVDSVPAILAVSRDRFIVFSSNALAILGLRALYFLLEGVRGRLVHLNKGLGVILFYVGVKMIASNWYHVDPFISLAIIAAILTVTVVASLRATRNATTGTTEHAPDPTPSSSDSAQPPTTPTVTDEERTV
ncbi:MAG: TerC family protein [Acidimicrobiia bacterium]